MSLKNYPVYGLVRRAGGRAVLIAALVLSSPVGAAESDWLVRNWQIEDGLPDNTVTAIQQTTDGYFWLGTYHSGLARFDGSQFKTFNAANTPELRSSRILSLMAEPTNTLWIGTEGGGLVKMSGGRFESVPLAEFGATGTVSSLFCGDDGVLWVLVAGKGVACLKNGQVSVFSETKELADGKLFTLSNDPAVLAWLSARKSLLTIRDDLRFGGSGGGVNFNGMQVIAAQRSRDGTVCLASATTVKKLTDRGLMPAGTPLDLAPELVSAQVTLVTEDKSGTLWVGTAVKGLYYSSGSAAFVRLKSEGPLSQHVISAIYEDQHGLLWVGTYGG